ncbi:hypothetical protein M2401_006448 [Pseudomonas sp. JUb42]|jgi:hypothetical protein|nr:hypothetical protein [Pseudomonas sp. JUb42]MCS3472683.1 hypothetical protein [Pseudomonas sp. JUb42]
MLVHLLTCLTLTALTGYVFSLILFSPLSNADNAHEDEHDHGPQRA